MAESAEWPHNGLKEETDLYGYRLVGFLGRGGFGITYQAKKDSQTFAIKECFPEQFSRRDGVRVVAANSDTIDSFEECLNRFIREAEALRIISVTHPDCQEIVKVITLFLKNGTAYLVMEYVPGLTLAAAINSARQGLPEEQIEFTLRKLLIGTKCIHDAGLLHRDIKPENILLRKTPLPSGAASSDMHLEAKFGSPVLIDFGAARTVDHDNSVYTKIFSPSFGPIEQRNGEKQGPFSDIYAIGTTLYRAIGGKVIDSSTRHNAVSKNLNDPQTPAIEIGAGRYRPEILETIDRAMIVSPNMRPQYVGELSGGIFDDNEETVWDKPKSRSAVDDTPFAPTQPCSQETSNIIRSSGKRIRKFLLISAGIGILAATFFASRLSSSSQSDAERTTATEAKIVAYNKLADAKLTISDLGLVSGGVLSEVNPLLNQAEQEFLAGNYSNATNRFNDITLNVVRITRNFLENQVKLKTDVIQKDLDGENTDGVEEILSSAEKIRQVEDSFK